MEREEDEDHREECEKRQKGLNEDGNKWCLTWVGRRIFTIEIKFREISFLGKCWIWEREAQHARA